MKVYGNAGRYALPLTASVAVRGASASLFTREDYFFTGVDPVTGAPTGLQLAQQLPLRQRRVRRGEKREDHCIEEPRSDVPG